MCCPSYYVISSSPFAILPAIFFSIKIKKEKEKEKKEKEKKQDTYSRETICKKEKKKILYLNYCNN
ncbi:hypothetical protein [Plasmodium yoelii yoelii]|uniref:Uncharacterized protein n=1 Tax=Plasmodium yoelii yoelii TaxID=73239 RepID=Q7RBP2_PLAYO|nr:hypothetical protein [Plasmodium yoelii yoelii]